MPIVYTRSDAAAAPLTPERRLQELSYVARFLTAIQDPENDDTARLAGETARLAYIATDDRVAAHVAGEAARAAYLSTERALAVWAINDRVAACGEVAAAFLAAERLLFDGRIKDIGCPGEEQRRLELLVEHLWRACEFILARKDREDPRPAIRRRKTKAKRAARETLRAQAR